MLMSLIRTVSPIIDFIYPKNDQMVVFGSSNGRFISGSSKIFYDHLVKLPDDYRTFYYLFPPPREVISFLTYILISAPTFFSARYLVSTNPPADFFPFTRWSRRKKIIIFGHGFPLKNIGVVDPSTTPKKARDLVWVYNTNSIVIASSTIEAEILARSFAIQKGRMVLAGQPRNDRLVRHTEDRVMNERCNSEKSVLYCPTWRPFAETVFFPFDNFDPQTLNDLLDKNRIKLVLRPHQLEKGEYARIEAIALESNGRISIMNQTMVPDINDVFTEFDALITDYSSIYMDFLLLDRPCIFIPYDLEEYEERIGFGMDSYDYWTPGAKVRSFAEFTKALTSVADGNDEFAGHRELVRKQIWPHQGSNSCEKILEEMMN